MLSAYRASDQAHSSRSTSRGWNALSLLAPLVALAGAGMLSTHDDVCRRVSPALAASAPSAVPTRKESAAIAAIGSAPGASEGPRSKTFNFIAHAVRDSAPSVVNLRKAITRGGVDYGISSGSGFVLNSEGIVITNAHVVAPDAQHLINREDAPGRGLYGGKTPSSGLVEKEPVLVTLGDGRKYRAHVHSVDLPSDVALVKIDEPPADLPVCKVGSSATLRAGEFVIALGSPLTLHNTVTLGIVSAVARHSSEFGLTAQRTEYVQTDAPINVGNSGGPLCNLDGEVVAISTMKVQGGDGISFAIPIDSAMVVIKQLLETGHVVRPYLGLKMVNFIVDEDAREQITRGFFGSGGSKRRQHVSPLDELLSDQPTQVMVVDVDDGSPAARCGLRRGDVIVTVDDKPIHTTVQVLEAIGLQTGRTLRLKVRRQDEKELLSIDVITEAEKPWGVRK